MLNDNDHYSILVNIGLLADAERQLKKAQGNLQRTIMEEEEEFCWSFDIKTKKADFDYYFHELYVYEFVSEQMESFLDEKEDVIIISTPDGYIYCGRSKKTVEEVSTANYHEAGLLPYYTTKRKIDGTIVWFCLTWSVIPFNPPNYN